MDFVKTIRRLIRQEVACPVLVYVDKCTCSSSGYSIDGRTVRAGSLEIMDETHKNIPLNPIWADKDGRGIYAPISVGQIVVVSYIEGNKAYPFVSGVYAESYKPASNPAPSTKALSLVDGKGEQITLYPEDKLMAVKNSSASLKQILTSICNAILGIKISGGKTNIDSETLVTPAVLDGSVSGTVSSIITSQINKLFKE